MKSSVSLLLLSAVLPAAVAFLPAPAVKTTTLQNLWGISASRPDSHIFADSNSVNIIIAGAPASGKGTQCEIIKDKFGVVHLSTGDMLRAAVAAKTEVGKLAKDFMDSGKLVPDEVIIGVVRRYTASENQSINRGPPMIASVFLKKLFYFCEII
jgi:hypothetical protein